MKKILSLFLFCFSVHAFATDGIDCVKPSVTTAQTETQETFTFTCTNNTPSPFDDFILTQQQQEGVPLESSSLSVNPNIAPFATETVTVQMTFATPGNYAFDFDRSYNGEQHGGAFCYQAPLANCWNITVSKKPDPVLPGTLYAGTVAGNIFVSSDGGANWSSPNKLDAFIMGLAVNDQHNVFAGTYEGTLFSSVDLGSHWTMFSNLEDPVGILAVDPSDRIYVGGEKGEIHVSSDQGKTWQTSGPLDRTTSITAIAVDNNSETVFAGTGNGRLFLSTDHGEHWSDGSSFDGSTISALFFDADQQMLYMATFKGQIAVSNNNGESFSSFSLDNNDRVLAFLKASDGFIYAGTRLGNFLQSQDKGIAWNKIANVIDAPIFSLTQDKQGALYAGVISLQASKNAIYKSTDGGAAWQLLSALDGSGIHNVIND